MNVQKARPVKPRRAGAGRPIQAGTTPRRRTPSRRKPWPVGWRRLPLAGGGGGLRTRLTVDLPPPRLGTPPPPPNALGFCRGWVRAAHAPVGQQALVGRHRPGGRPVLSARVRIEGPEGRRAHAKTAKSAKTLLRNRRARGFPHRRQESSRGPERPVAPGEQDSAQLLNASSGHVDRDRQGA